MNTHLTSEQISEWILGDRKKEAERHLRVCPSCQAELNQFEASLNVFRDSVRLWSEEQLPPATPLPIKQKGAHLFKITLGWATAVLALCLLVVRVTDRPGPQLQTAAASAADAALLAQIDHEVSRTVPDSMEPLTQLVSWDAGSSASASGKSSSESQAQ